MDDVQRVDIDLRQPLHHLLVFVHDFVVIQIFRSNRPVFRTDLLAGNFIDTAVDRVQQALRQIRAGAEELHFLADAH